MLDTKKIRSWEKTGTTFNMLLDKNWIIIVFMKGTHLLVTLRHRYDFCMVPQCIDDEDVILAFLWSTCEGVLCPNHVGTVLVPEALSLQCKHQRMLSSVSTFIGNNNPYQQSGKKQTLLKSICVILAVLKSKCHYGDTRTLGNIVTNISALAYASK